MRCTVLAFVVLGVASSAARAADVSATSQSSKTVRQATAIDPVSAHAEQIAALRSKLTELNRLQREIQTLRTATKTPEQIIVHVEVLEASLTKMQRLGIELASFEAALPIAGDHSNRRPTGGTHILSQQSAGAMLRKLKDENVAKTLAAPTLVVPNGRPGSFLVGGEIPLPAPPNSNQAVMFQEFGTRVDVTATSLGDNRLKLEIHPRISTLDESHALEINGRRIPSVRVREARTACNLSFDETVVIAADLQERVESVRLSTGRTEERTNQIATLLVVSAVPGDALDPGPTRSDP